MGLLNRINGKEKKEINGIVPAEEKKDLFRLDYIICDVCGKTEDNLKKAFFVPMDVFWDSENAFQIFKNKFPSESEDTLKRVFIKTSTWEKDVYKNSGKFVCEDCIDLFR